MAKEYKTEYCMDCKSDHSDKQKEEICECGGRNFIFGDTVVLEDGKFKCSCGSDEFRLIARVNMNPVYNGTYMCSKCGAIVVKQLYLEE